MAGKTRAWQEFSRLGQCYVPQAVWQEVQYLCDRASEVDLEQTAREFTRFYPTSGWQETRVSASHPALQPPKGANLSGRARLSQAIAECAYGLSQQQPEALVVLVANDQPLLQRVQALANLNLCGIPVAALAQWCRTHQRPGVVNQQLQQMVLASNSAASATLDTIAPTNLPSSLPDRSPPIATKSAVRTTSTIATRATPPVATASGRRRSTHPSSVSQILSGILAMGMFAIVLLIGWRMVQPKSFDRFWQTTIAPLLPGQSPQKPTKPAPKN
jgi:hypothetical protein